MFSLCPGQQYLLREYHCHCVVHNYVCVYCDSLRMLECPKAPVVGKETPRISSSFSSATSCTYQSKKYISIIAHRPIQHTCESSTYQWVPASKDAHTVEIFSQLLVYLWTSAKLTNFFLHFLKKGGWNRLVSHLGIKQITDIRRADELIRL